jgi:hypothetical protein
MKASKADLKSNLFYDTKAKIQTGPAVPQWKWREVSFGWRGPVAADEKISLWLIPSGVERLIGFSRVIDPCCCLGVGAMLGPLWRREGIAARQRQDVAEGMAAHELRHGTFRSIPLI